MKFPKPCRARLLDRDLEQRPPADRQQRLRCRVSQWPQPAAETAGHDHDNRLIAQFQQHRVKRDEADNAVLGVDDGELMDGVLAHHRHRSLAAAAFNKRQRV